MTNECKCGIMFITKGVFVLVDKLIRGKIIEITVVIVMVLLSIPVWDSFEDKISAANIMEIDDYNVSFDVTTDGNTDNIIVDNEYYINKQYKVLLVVDRKVDEENSNITINGKVYELSDFYYEKNRNNNIYTLVSDYIVADKVTYNITPNISGDNNNYSYIFEEKSIF